MDIFRSIGGMISVEITSADPAGALTAINLSGISVFDARQTGGLTLRLVIHRKDYPILQKLIHRRGEKLELLGRLGLYWQLKGLLARPVLLIGMALLLFLVTFLPSRVLFIRVEGNETVPTRLILEKAEACGIGFGASRREVRSEKMKNALLGAIPELQWAGINTAGCVATISVRERTLQTQETQSTGVSSIVALRDGVVRECTVLKGTALCKVGQAVKEGEVLISGYTDCGICIRATRAEGEIYAETKHDLQAVTPETAAVRGEIIRVEKKFSLLLGKNRINFYEDSGILDSTCVKMYEENYLTLPGGFQLPIALVTEQWTYYDCYASPVPEDDAAGILTEFAQGYLSRQMVAGQILKKQETVDGYRLHGQYACLEMIGQMKYEEIIQSDGENN